MAPDWTKGTGLRTAAVGAGVPMHGPTAGWGSMVPGKG